MENLIELSKIVTRQRLKKIDALYKNETQYLMIADKISKGEIKNDDDAAKLISSKKDRGNFKMFKTRLKEKLLNSLLFLDFDERTISNYGRAISDSSKSQHGIRLLLYLNARQTAIKLAHSTFNKAVKFEIADVALYCARKLRLHYSYLGNTKEFANYNKLVQKYKKVLIDEILASELLETLFLTHVNRNIYDDNKPSSVILDEITLIYNKNPTYQIGLNYYRVKGITHFISEEYKKALENWNELDRYIEKYKHFEFDVRMGESALNKMNCYLYMRDFINAQDCVKLCNKFFKRYSNNWFVAQESFFLLAMHTQNYDSAMSILNLVLEPYHFKAQIETLQEKWNLFEAYFYVMEKLKKGQTQYISKRRQTFRFKSILYSLPTFAKDKMGYNTSLLILEILFALNDKKYNEITDRIEALERYCTRYFEKDNFYRSRLFLEMIIIVAKCDYNIDKIKIKTTDLCKILSEPHQKYGAYSEGLEIVPYADLWEIILKALEEKV